MKKLMTMLAAAAMSFGLFADLTLPVGTSFETLTKGEVAVGDIEGALWSTTDDAAKLEAVDGVLLPYSSQKPIGSRLSIFSGDNTISLKVKTTFDKPLYRSETWAWDAEKGIYFDALVNFTFCDEAPAAAEQGVKLMLWAQDLSDAETPAAETNLYVRALCGETAKDYLIGSADEDVHRITVKVIPTITKSGTHPGFVIYKDGEACICQETYDIGYTADQLNTKAAKFFGEKTLFVSLDQTSSDRSKLTAVGFAGQGVIDDVAITDVAPVVAAADPIVQQITLAEGVSSVKWNGTTYEGTFEAIVDGGVVALDEVNYEAGYTNPADWDMSTRQLPYKGGWEVPSMEALVKIGNKYYASLKEAFADTDALTAASGVVQISAPLRIEEGEEVTTEYTGTITIDLNGKTITYEGTGTAITAADLVILDNSTIGTTDDSGAIVAAAGSAIEATNLSIVNGKFQGWITGDAGSIGGWFDVDPDDSYGIVADGYTVAELSGKDLYQYEIVEDTSFTVTVTAPGDGSHVSIASVVDADGKTVTPGVDGSVKTEKPITVTYSLATGYMLAKDSAALEQTLSADGEASVVPTAALVIAKVGTEEYASVQDAINANKGHDTEAAVEIQLVAEGESVELAGFNFEAETYKTKGAIVDFNGCTVTFTKGCPKSSDNPFRSYKMNIVTLKNGTLLQDYTYEEEEVTMSPNDMIRNFGAVLNLENLTINGANCSGGYAIRSLSGDINVLGTTSITAPQNGSIAKIGDYTSSSYTVGTLTFNTTGTITGDLGLYGGKIDVKAIGTNNIGKYFFGATTHSEWADDADITEGGYFAARVGAIPARPEATSTYVDGGELFTELSSALADATEKEVYLLKDVTLSDNTTWTKAVNANTKKITLGAYTLTANKALADGDFVVPDDKVLDKSGEGPYVYKLAAKSVDPVPVPTPVDPETDKKNVADALLEKGITAPSIDSVEKLVALNTFLTGKGVTDAGALNANQKTNLNDTFLLKDIADKILEDKAAIEVTEVSPTEITIVVKEGATALELAKTAEEALAGKVVAGAALDEMAPVTADQVEVTLAEDGMSAKVTVEYGDENSGFIKMSVK